MKVTYLDHSGFIVEYKSYVLIFDWYRGQLPEFGSQKKIYVFASHSHYDHFNKKIFGWKKQYPDIQYILSSDILGGKDLEQVTYVTADREYQFGDIKVQTLHSTDEGVAFVVNVEDKVIYHAGDLNWWHWKEESDSYNEQMRKDYQKEIKKLKEIPIDVAFVPLDPRQEEQYNWGLDYFMKNTHTRRVFPMHMWGHYEVYDRLIKSTEADSYKDRIVQVKEPGQVFYM